MTGLLSETAYAKINLALHIRARRPDGYHELETLFAFAEDGDRLSGRLANEIVISISGPYAASLAGEAENLVLRAAHALQAAAGIAHGAALRLEKNLPVAAGLGEVRPMPRRPCGWLPGSGVSRPMTPQSWRLPGRLVQTFPPVFRA